MSLNAEPPVGIGLALSGGGVRAMAFHAGVMKWLAEDNRLHLVTDVSTVSGGSLFVGLMLRLSNWQWPDSSVYPAETYPQIRRILTTTDLQHQALRLLANPSNWRYLLSRANVLAKAIEKLWGIPDSLQVLPGSPNWSINGTTAETGRRFRFKKGACGDYEIGYAAASDFKLAEAMAASAAYPFLIGPLSIDPKRFIWHKREQWGDAPGTEQRVEPRFGRLHILDGGVYDNLAMEPLFDVGKREAKVPVDQLICSDAGAPLPREALASQFRLERAKRVVAITMDQARALRVRAFMEFLQARPNAARYLQIGANPRQVADRFSTKVDLAIMSSNQWLSDSDISQAAAWPTDLAKISEKDFDLIARHGYETAKWNETGFLR